MAYRYEGRIPLGSTMREKGEFLPSATQKHASSLRIPEDTSWPKIPERRIHENVASGSKAPCVVTISGKPQKNRTTVQLTHSQFVKAVPRRNELECHNSANRPAQLQSNTREGCHAHAGLATQNIAPSSRGEAKKQIEKDTKEKLDQIKNAVNADSEREYEANLLGGTKTSRVQLDNRSAAAIKHHSSIINQDADQEFISTSNKSKATRGNDSQEIVMKEVKNCTDVQGNRDFRNANDGDTIKKCSAASSVCSSGSRDHQDCGCNSSNCDCFKLLNTPLDRQWVPAISRSSRLRAAETSDSEIYSSDTTKSCVTQSSLDRGTRQRDKKGLKERDYPRKSYYRGSKSPSKKGGDPNSCCGNSRLKGNVGMTISKKKLPAGIRCDKCQARRPRHRSEPQIGNSPRSRRCWTAGHGKPVCCCTRDFHRVASDSNCWSAMHASEPGAKEHRRPQHTSREPDDALSYPGALQALLSREGDALKVQMLLDNKDHAEKLAEESSAYACQLAMGAPRIKRRRSTKDGQTGATAEEKLAATKGASVCPHKTNPPGERQADSRFFKLKTAVILSCAIIVLILSLPTIYDYFFYEEYDSYEELSYIELIFEYIVSSFQEAFGGVFDFISKVFFHSRTCRKCNNVN